jgi:hypothetical protein
LVPPLFLFLHLPQLLLNFPLHVPSFHLLAVLMLMLLLLTLLLLQLHNFIHPRSVFPLQLTTYHLTTTTTSTFLPLLHPIAILHFFWHQLLQQ